MRRSAARLVEVGKAGSLLDWVRMGLRRWGKRSLDEMVISRIRIVSNLGIVHVRLARMAVMEVVAAVILAIVAVRMVLSSGEAVAPPPPPRPRMLAGVVARESWIWMW
jgi:hypothetical protein